jgi:hypothetical protein
VGTNQRLAADIEIYVCPGCQTDDKKIICKDIFFSEISMILNSILNNQFYFEFR